MVIDPINSQIVYAGSDGSGVFKSTNGGVSWSAINNGLINKYVSDMVIDPSNPAVLYTGTWGDGVFRSTNGGESWSSVNMGLTNKTIIPLVFHPSNPTILYAGTLGSGVFKGIISWQPRLVDAISLLQVMSGRNPSGIPANFDISRIDINNDGRIDLADIIYALQVIAELR